MHRGTLVLALLLAAPALALPAAHGTLADALRADILAHTRNPPPTTLANGVVTGFDAALAPLAALPGPRASAAAPLAKDAGVGLPPGPRCSWVAGVGSAYVAGYAPAPPEALTVETVVGAPLVNEVGCPGDPYEHWLGAVRGTPAKGVLETSACLGVDPGAGVGGWLLNPAVERYSCYWGGGGTPVPYGRFTFVGDVGRLYDLQGCYEGYCWHYTSIGGGFHGSQGRGAVVGALD